MSASATSDHVHRPRGGNGKFITSLSTAQRDAEALRLRSQGWTFERIAQELGMRGGRSNAEKAVKRALEKIKSPAAEELRKTQQEALDRMKAVAFDVMERRHVAHGNGRLIEQWDDVQKEMVPVLDDGPKLDAIKTLIQVFSREAKLHGVDAPVKVEQEANGTVRIEIKGIDADKL